MKVSDYMTTTVNVATGAEPVRFCGKAFMIYSTQLQNVLSFS